MKKILSVLILLVYLSVSTGFVVSRHFCMGRIDSVQLGEADSDVCSRCGMHKGDNMCCHDEISVLRLDNEHFTSKWTFNLPEAPGLPEQMVSLLLSPFRNFTPLPRFTDGGPPPDEGLDVYLQNCVFRI